MVVTAQAESQQRVLAGRGEGSRLLQVGLSEASVLLRKIQSYSDPRLFALAMVAEKLAESKQPLVPERVFMAGGEGQSADRRASAAAEPGGLRAPAQPARGREVRLRPRPTTGASAVAPGVRRPDDPRGDGVDPRDARGRRDDPGGGLERPALGLISPVVATSRRARRRRDVCLSTFPALREWESLEPGASRRPRGFRVIPRSSPRRSPPHPNPPPQGGRAFLWLPPPLWGRVGVGGSVASRETLE